MHRRPLDTQVLIIGNGPAGLALSAFLSGVQPFYNVDRPHSNELIHERLSAAAHLSLLDQDLGWAEHLTDLTASASRPLSVLYDMLARPDADVSSPGPSCLHWEVDPSRVVPHIVIGETPIGGSWNNYDPEMLTVSFAQLLDLPGYSIEEWLGGTPLIPRLPSMAIVSYMQTYAKQLGIKQHFCTKKKVTSIKKVDDVWVTEGRSSEGRPFSISSKFVVLACGKTSAKKLGLENEDECKNIVYDVKTFKARVELDTKLGKSYTIPGNASTSGVVVVGDGISSADAVRSCLEREIPVVHVMRRTDRQLRNVMMSRLTATHYGEYANVYKLMIGHQKDPLYRRHTGASVVDVSPKSVVVAATGGGDVVELPYALLAVCVGRESDFDGVLHGKYSFGSYASEQDNTLLSVGSFAGDHFVRYLVGGCLQVARDVVAAVKSDAGRDDNRDANDVVARPALLEAARSRRRRCAWNGLQLCGFLLEGRSN